MTFFLFNHPRVIGDRTKGVKHDWETSFLQFGEPVTPFPLNDSVQAQVQYGGQPIGSVRFGFTLRQKIQVNTGFSSVGL